MIAFLDGIISSKRDNRLVLDVGGVGYFLSMPSASLAALPAEGEQARVFCFMSVSDAGIALYGFISEDERFVFEKLIGVNGIGPKIAIAALSVYSPESLQSIIAMQDESALSKVPGLGKKTASRIILELKDAFSKQSVNVASISCNTAYSGSLESVAEALSSMGFSAAEVAKALEGADPNEQESKLLASSLRKLA